MIIVYCSNAGHTERYARYLASALRLPAYRLSELPDSQYGKDAVFLGWINNGTLSGYLSALSKCNILYAVGVGMSPEHPYSATSLFWENDLESETRTFYIRGGFDIHLLSKKEQKIISPQVVELIDELITKFPQTEEDRMMIRNLRDGFDDFSPDKLSLLIDCLRNEDS